jgi:hypothetical protein
MNYLILAVKADGDGKQSFYLYTTESIDNIRYTDLTQKETFDLLDIEKISLLSYKNINIDDIDIPEFMIPNLYRITYQLIPGITTKISLRNSNEQPVINLDIFEANNDFEHKFLTSMKNCYYENGELKDTVKMVCERIHKNNFFDEYDTFIIGENQLSFDKLKMNLECFKAIHELKELKIIMNVIKSTSYNAPDENKGLHIQQCFISFDCFIENLLEQIIRSTYELHNFKDNELPFGEKKWSQVVDYVFCLTKIVTKCFTIFKNVNFIEKYGNGFKQYNFSDSEIEKIFKNIVEFYENDNKIGTLLDNTMDIDEDCDECYIQTSDFLAHYLEFVSLIENFIIKSKSSKLLSASDQKNNTLPFIMAVKWTKEVLTKHFNNLSNYSLRDLKNFSSLRSVILKSIIKNCLVIESLFKSLSEIFKTVPHNEPLLDEIFVDFEKNLKEHKDAIFEYKNEFESFLYDMSFEKNIFINEIIFRLQGNNDFKNLTIN